MLRPTPREKLLDAVSRMCDDGCAMTENRNHFAALHGPLPSGICHCTCTGGFFLKALGVSAHERIL